MPAEPGVDGWTAGEMLMEVPRAQEGIGRPMGELGSSPLCFVLGLCGSHPISWSSL